MSTLKKFIGKDNYQIIPKNNLNPLTQAEVLTSQLNKEALCEIVSTSKFGTNGIMSTPWKIKTFPHITRYFHSAVTYNNGTDQIMIVFGGYDGTSYLNDVWEYNITQDAWTQKTSGATARYAHSAVTYNNGIDQIMIVFGGNNGTSVINDVWQYNITQDTWTQKTSGATARYFLSEVTYNNGTDQMMVIFGGQSTVSPTNDTWEYNITQDIWTQKLSGSTARYGHKAVTYNNGIDQMMILFGGYSIPYGANRNEIWEYNITQNIWTQKKTSMLAIRHHSQVTYNNGTDQIMLVFGGTDGTFTHNEIWEYNITKDIWTQKTQYPKARKHHSAVTYNNGIDQIMVIHGGFDTINSNNETWEYNISIEEFSQNNTIVKNLL